MVDFAVSYFDRIDRPDWNFVAADCPDLRFEQIDRPSVKFELTADHLVVIGSIHVEVDRFGQSREKFDCPDPNFAQIETRFEQTGWNLMVADQSPVRFGLSLLDVDWHFAHFGSNFVRFELSFGRIEGFGSKSRDSGRPDCHFDWVCSVD